LSVLGFDLPTLALIGAAALVAFIVRGLTGFGSSMIGIGSMSIVLPPAQVVPAFLLVELLTTVNLLPSVWRAIDWRSLRWVVIGCALSTPLGVLALQGLAADTMRAVISGLLLLVSGAMLAGAKVQSTPGPAGTFAVGIASGLLNGAAGIGGPPAIVFYFATARAAVGRATLIAFFLFTDIYMLAWAGTLGALDAAAWRLVGAALPLSLVGIWIGGRIFARLHEADLRRTVWLLLAAIGAAGIVFAAWRLLR